MKHRSGLDTRAVLVTVVATEMIALLGVALVVLRQAADPKEVLILITAITVPTIAALLALLKVSGEQKEELIVQNEKLDTIEKAVNGEMERKFAALEAEIVALKAEIKALLGKG